jgi:hypothetical protein
MQVLRDAAAPSWSPTKHGSRTVGYPKGMEPIPETVEAMEEFGPFAEGDLLGELRQQGVRVRGLVPDLVGLSLASVEHDVTLTLVASSEEIAVLDGVQYLFGGPCVDAVEANAVREYNDDDVLDERAWQQFSLATAHAAVASTLTLPVLAEDLVVGSVNLYAASRNAFGDMHQEIADVFHAWAPGAVTNADLSFDTRKAAEQAPGKPSCRSGHGHPRGLVRNQPRRRTRRTHTGRPPSRSGRGRPGRERHRNRRHQRRRLKLQRDERGHLPRPRGWKERRQTAITGQDVSPAFRRTRATCRRTARLTGDQPLCTDEVLVSPGARGARLPKRAPSGTREQA